MEYAYGEKLAAKKTLQETALTADDLRKENLAYKQQIEAYQRQIKILETDYTKAELVRLNTELAQLNEYIDRMTGHLHGLTRDRNDAVTKANYYTGLLAKLRKALGVESTKEVLAALTALKR